MELSSAIMSDQEEDMALFKTEINGVVHDVTDCGYIRVGKEQIAGLVVSRLPQDTFEIGSLVQCKDLDGDRQPYFTEVVRITGDFVSLALALEK